MCGIYCVYKQSRSCQLPFCASPIFHFEIGDFSVYIYSILDKRSQASRVIITCWEVHILNMSLGAFQRIL